MASVDPRLRRPPGAAPWLGARRIQALGVFWPFLLVALAALEIELALSDDPPALRAGTVAWIALVLVLHALGSVWAVRARSTEGVTGRALLMHVLACCAGILTVIGWKKGLSPDLAIAAFVLALSLASPVVLLQGALVAIAQRVLRRPGHDSRERVLVTTAACAAAMGAVWPLGWLVGSREAATFPWAWTVVTVGVPVAGVAWAVARQIGWRRWLQAVAKGEIAGWAIVDHTARDVSTLAPVLASTASQGARTRVLVWTQPTATPFREAEMEVPVALVVAERE
jgi:hypothetical protein